MSASTGLAVQPAVTTTAEPAAPRRKRGIPLRPGLALAVLFLAFLITAAIVPKLLATEGPLDGTGINMPFLGVFSPGHLFGTDEVGRDTYSRLVYGARPSLTMGLGATAIGVTGGTLLGLVAGLGNRWVETVVMRLVDVLLSIPDLLLALVVIALLGAGSIDALFAVGVAAIPNYARIVRAQTRVVRRSAYVEAAHALGLRRLTVIARHVLPNAIKPLLVLATLGVGSAIGVGASLSFLGLGAKPPAAEWGSMLSTGIQYLSASPSQVIMPGLTITATVLAITVVGRALRRWSEGREA